METALSEKSLRLFLAIGLPDALKHELAEQASLIRAHWERTGQASVRRWAWIQAENFHLTLKFLGAVSESKVPRISSETRDAVRCASPFELQLGQIGHFPRVLWCDVQDPTATLNRLVQEIEDRLFALDFSKENRKFVPHLTLARLKEGKSLRALKDEIPGAILSLGTLRSWKVADVLLYESQTLKTGAVYRIVDRIPLLAGS